ncbi:hypothetical protein CAPTEDRAFT_196314 [Capitella teleta]|uniref:Uncharacterized protein n=1 Tax=Capitella teleta TaxID=283909 RepID=R7T905_CAPTE|nr:hypothetical protein CAPTEDRAFT_196314 [Capitella teleta]|eukprot:ELT87885.1 hypothetical protein CAPTEDRAFT_196314 [Capitella teleta]
MSFDKMNDYLMRETSLVDGDLDNGGCEGMPTTPPAYTQGEVPVPASPPAQVIHVVEPVHIHQVPHHPDPIPAPKKRRLLNARCAIAALVVLLFLFVCLSAVVFSFCFIGGNSNCFNEVNQSMGNLPGRYTNPNDQCIQLFGKESYYCGLYECNMTTALGQRKGMSVVKMHAFIRPSTSIPRGFARHAEKQAIDNVSMSLLVEAKQREALMAFNNIKRGFQPGYTIEPTTIQGATEDGKLCQELQCFHPSLRYCFTNHELRAVEGTTCGNKRGSSLP